MICRRGFGRLKKRAAALAVSMVMVMGAAAALPVELVKGNVMTANAWDYKSAHTFFCEKIGDNEVRLLGVEIGDRSMRIPSTMQIDGQDYTVTEIGDNFAAGASLETLIIPDTVKRIGDNFARYSVVSSVTVPNDIEYIGENFCADCSSLWKVTFDGNKLEHLGEGAFGGNDLPAGHYKNHPNMKGGVRFGDWLVSYFGTESEIKVNELGIAQPIKGIISNAFVLPNNMGYDPENIVSIDLEGIKYIQDGAFRDCTNLEEIKNSEDVEYVGAYALHYTKWYAQEKQNGSSTLGKVLMWYKTSADTIDLTSNSFKDIKQVYRFAFLNCQNLSVIKTNKNIDISDVTVIKTASDEVYSEERVGISKLYVDGKEIAYNAKKPVDSSLSAYARVLEGTQLEAELIEAKTQAVFKELGVKYYGVGRKASSISEADTRNTVKKLHDYICENYTYGSQATTLLDGYLAGKKMDSAQLASLYAYMLRSAGLESMVVTSKADLSRNKGDYVYDHTWTLVKIGANWYHSDVCWDSASQGNTLRYFLMSDAQTANLPQHKGWELANPMGLSVLEGVSLPACKVQIGDTNGDGMLSSGDIAGYADIVQGKAKANANTDINFDGKTDIDDLLYLEHVLSDNIFKPTNTEAKPENSVIALNGKVLDMPNEKANNYRVLILDEKTILSDGCITASSSYYELPAFTYKAPAYDEFKSWDLGEPGTRVQLSREVTILRPVWKNDVKLGDVNFDGNIDIQDAVAIISHINGIKVLSDKALKAANVYKDDVIDIADATRIIGYVNGLNQI